MRAVLRRRPRRRAVLLLNPQCFDEDPAGVEVVYSFTPLAVQTALFQVHAKYREMYTSKLYYTMTMTIL